MLIRKKWSIIGGSEGEGPILKGGIIFLDHQNMPLFTRKIGLFKSKNSKDVIFPPAFTFHCLVNSKLKI